MSTSNPKNKYVQTVQRGGGVEVMPAREPAKIRATRPVRAARTDKKRQGRSC